MAENRVLYWGSGSPPCWRVMAMLEHKGLPYDSKVLQMMKGEHKGPEVLALNPRGQVPTFKDGDAVVNDSGAALLYLESQYPDNPLLPSDPATKATVLQRLFESTVTASVFAPFVGGKAEYALWDKYASKQKYIASDEFTLADVMVAPYMLVMCRFGSTLKDYPNLKKYCDMVKVSARQLLVQNELWCVALQEHPSIAKSTPPHWAKEEPTWNFMNVL